MNIANEVQLTFRYIIRITGIINKMRDYSETWVLWNFKGRLSFITYLYCLVE